MKEGHRDDHMWRLGHRPGLDQLRGVAALVVVLAHTRGALAGLRLSGGVGVEMFFTLSGFLITSLLLEERGRTGTIRLRSFYVRRARRLAPAIPITLLLCGWAASTVGDGWLAPTVSVVTYTANYVMIDPDFGNGFGQFWSLAVEEHFYLVWPTVLLVVPPRHLLKICVLVGTASAVWRIETLANGHPNLGYFATHLRLDGLLIGAALATTMPRRPRVSTVTVRIAILTLAACLLMPRMIAGGLGTVLVHLCTAIVILGLLDGTKPRRWLEHAGQISYGLYLLHAPIFMLVSHHLAGGELGMWTALLAIGVSWGAAELSYRLIEARFRSAPRGSSKPAPEAASAAPGPVTSPA